MAPEQVDAAQAPAGDRGHLLEHLIARGMAQRVVHRLEMIDVHYADREAAVQAAGARQLSREGFHEEAPVVRSRELVPDGDLLDPCEGILQPAVALGKPGGPPG